MTAHRAQSDHRQADWTITDPGDAGAIPVHKSGICSLVTTAAETRTLAAPTYAGQRLVISAKTIVTECVVTCATAVNTSGNNTIAFVDAGATLDLVGVYVGDNLRWRALSPQTTVDNTDAEGPTLSTI